MAFTTTPANRAANQRRTNERDTQLQLVVQGIREQPEDRVQVARAIEASSESQWIRAAAEFRAADLSPAEEPSIEQVVFQAGQERASRSAGPIR